MQLPAGHGAISRRATVVCMPTTARLAGALRAVRLARRRVLAGAAFLAGALRGGAALAWPARPWRRRSSWPAAAFVAGAALAAAFLAGRPWRGGGLLGRRSLGGVGAAALAGGSLGGGGLLGRSGLGHLAAAGDDLLELGAGTEGRNRGLLDPNLGAGGRVSPDAGGPIAPLEGAEAGQDDLLALDDVGVDLVEDRVQDAGGGLVVGIQSSRNGVDELGLVQAQFSLMCCVS